MTCMYCQKDRPFDEEHVLSRALSGPGEDWVLKDLVCKTCNRLFSLNERAWLSEPGVAMARIAHGPVGRDRKGQAFQFHPSELMFLEADGDPISYEVDILPGVAPRLRYQVIDKGDEVVPVASHADDVARFAKSWREFTARPEVTLQKKKVGEQAQYRVAELRLKGAPAIVKIEWRSKPAMAWRDKFGANFGRSRAPRLSLDPFGRIRFRTERLSQIPKLLGRIFAAGQMTSTPKTHETGTYHIAARGVYDLDKVPRAVAKTIANYMADQIGETFVRQPSIRPFLDYCIGGPDHAGPGPFVGVHFNATGIADFDTLPSDRHGLMLISDGVHVVGGLKLYGTSHSYKVRVGPSPDGRSFLRLTRIDYNGLGRVAV